MPGRNNSYASIKYSEAHETGRYFEFRHAKKCSEVSLQLYTSVKRFGKEVEMDRIVMQSRQKDYFKHLYSSIRTVKISAYAADALFDES